MYSQCPECLTRFRVTAEALRAAHGTVRCGRCGSAFDALPRLSDTLLELTDAAPAGIAATLPGGTDSLTGTRTDDGTLLTEFHFSADDIEQVFVDARDWQRRFGDAPRVSSPDDELAADLAAAGAMEQAGADDAGAGATAAASARAGEDVFVHEPEDVEDITLEGERIVIEGRTDEEESSEQFGDDAERLPPPPGAAAEPDLDSTDRFDAQKVRAAMAALAGDAGDSGATPTLPEDEFERQIERALQQSLAAESVSAAEAPVTAESAAARAAPAVSTIEPEPAVAVSRAAPVEPKVAAAERPRIDEHADLPLDDDAEGSTRSRGQGLVWGLGALLLALLLAAQLTHHFRQELARDPYLGPPVRALYAQLGMPLASNWNLAAFELRQWGAGGSAPTADGRLTIRASLRNRATFAQPMPLLRLELEDRFGGSVARRDFEPREYLKDPAQATRLLARDASTEAEIAIVGAPAEAVGYRLDVCMRDETGAVRCAVAEQDSASP
jgi:predicted Zn finger-like uncharacterized protein